MSNLNIGTLPRLSASLLRTYLLNPATAPSLSIIDVRDSDYIGGHIRASSHCPTSQHAHALPELARKLATKRLVVFHCMLCQQRGPKAALEYARARERLLGSKGSCLSREDVKWEDEGTDMKEGETSGQIVAYLDGGFASWQSEGFAEDERVTEGYDKRLWEEGGLD